MAVVIYQTTAGYVNISGKEIPLSNCNMTSYLNPITTKYEVSFRKISSGGAWATNIPLENIEDDQDNTYATIDAWNAIWNSYTVGGVTNELNGSNPGTGYATKAYIKDGNFVVEKELTATGFDGSENTDWERTFSN